ncbi:2-phospho-L-lactate guanylyltransferase [Agromyces atrinae]|uniref:2-phospho-L-lactate guanylyltransferase n=1 Tax=Agromyces atrinae TaxID=592376 RepID=UPI001F59D38F|nr:2-phospho-L-lactate guanylyltransferase [Agromyces atrinae]MCI2956557.1 2-phospho-L-lactate guanylyltransferase [Agromyces atrinae]
MQKWHVIVPVKRAAAGKSRFAPAVAPDLRVELARAFALDTVSAAAEATLVETVHVVSDEFAVSDARVRVLGGAPDGLNPALAYGLAVVREQHPDSPVAVLLGDLPALRGDDLDAVLTAAHRHPLAFVRDADGEGTTTLAVQPGVDYVPVFGGPSAAAHLAAGAVDISDDAPSRARRDVDGVEALRDAAMLGLSISTNRLASALVPLSRERIEP